MDATEHPDRPGVRATGGTEGGSVTGRPLGVGSQGVLRGRGLFSPEVATGARVVPIRQGPAPGPALPAVHRERCTNEVGGRPCRNYAVLDGLCRLCLPPEDRALLVSAIDDVVDDEPRGGIELLEALRDAVGDEALDLLRDVAGFLRRRVTGDYEVDEFGFDPDFTDHVVLPLLRPLHRRYWRVLSVGSEHVPMRGGGLIVANHAGTIPVDALMTRLDLYEQTGRHTRELAADLVFRSPFLGHLGRKTGATLASGEDADRLLAAGELVAVWPEGFKGVGKKYKDRYRLQRFGRGGFVATALRSGTPIIPTAIVGSEEIYPLIFDLKPLARVLGLPYFPITAQMLALPLLGPAALLPLPSRWIIEYGEPIETASYGSDAADDPMVVFDLADQVRETIQQMLYRNLMGRRSVFL